MASSGGQADVRHPLPAQSAHVNFAERRRLNLVLRLETQRCRALACGLRVGRVRRMPPGFEHRAHVDACRLVPCYQLQVVAVQILQVLPHLSEDLVIQVSVPRSPHLRTAGIPLAESASAAWAVWPYHIEMDRALGLGEQLHGDRHRRRRPTCTRQPLGRTA
jgi:hypothetical protein